MLLLVALLVDGFRYLLLQFFYKVNRFNTEFSRDAPQFSFFIDALFVANPVFGSYACELPFSLIYIERQRIKIE